MAGKYLRIDIASLTHSDWTLVVSADNARRLAGGARKARTSRVARRAAGFVVPLGNHRGYAIRIAHVISPGHAPILFLHAQLLPRIVRA